MCLISKNHKYRYIASDLSALLKHFKKKCTFEYLGLKYKKNYMHIKELKCVLILMNQKGLHIPKDLSVLLKIKRTF